MNVTIIPTTNDPVVPFSSATSIREVHARLLKLQREDPDGPALLTEVETFVRQTQASGALLDSDDDRWAIQGLLDYWATRLYRAGREPSDTVLADFDPSLAPELDDERCPYLGLDSFRETRRHLFFGRERLIDEWLARLKDECLLAAIGSSGSGKSSLVLAGLVPALKSGQVPGSRDWRYLVPIVPGPNPLESLARPLLPPDVDVATWTRAQVHGFRSDPGHLVKLLGSEGDRPCVLIVDQFEELFTLCRDESLTEAFVENLIQMIRTPSPRHIAIVTMRTDFEGQVARLPELQRLVERARAPVGALNAAELREAIERPAEMVGLRFEDGVVDELIKEILGEPAGLPLLQFTLWKLWQKRERNRVTMPTYQRLGGARRALERSAEVLYQNMLREDQQEAERILLRMVRPGQGVEFTSNRVRRDSLFTAAGATDRVERVLGRLVEARLIRQTEGESASDIQVEVAHEALVRNWDRLAGWLEAERATMRLRLQLTAAAERWEELRRHPDGLWRGKLLEEALSYDDLNHLEHEFVQASREARETARREREAARRHEREQRAALRAQQQRALEERRHAEEQAREATRLRRHRMVFIKLSAVAFSACLLTAVAAIVAFSQYGRAEDQKHIAEEQADIATSRQLVAQALGQLGNQPTLATLLSVAAYDTHDTFEARSLLYSRVVSAPIQTEIVRKYAGAVGAVAFSPDGRMLASGSTDGALVIRDLSARSTLSHELFGPSFAVTSLAFGPDSTVLALGSADGKLQLWDASSPEQYEPIQTGNSAAVSSLAFSPDGARLIVGSANGALTIVDLATKVSRSLQPISTLSASTVSSLTLSVDGTVLGIGLDDGGLVLWNVEEDRLIGSRIVGNGRAPTSLAFSPDGKMFAAGGNDRAAGGNERTIGLWDATTGQPRGGLQIDRTAGVTAMAFSPNGDLLVSGTQDGSFLFWDVTNKRPLRSPIRDAAASITSIAFSPDGQKLAIGDKAIGDKLGRLVLYDVSIVGRLVLGETLVDSQVTTPGVAFSAEERHPLLASIGAENTIVLWDGNTYERVDPPLPGQTEDVTSHALSPDGKRLVSGDATGTLVLWDVANRKPLAPPVPAHAEAVSHVAFSADGKKIVSGGGDGTLSVWDGTTLEPIASLLHVHSAAVFAAAFSPDGHTIASGGSDGVLLWDLTAGGHTWLDQSSDESDGMVDILSLTFSPNGAILAVGGSSGTVGLWDVAARRRTGRLGADSSTLGLDVGQSTRTDRSSPIASSPGAAAVTSLTFSPDGQSIASGHGAGAIILWDVVTRQRLGPALDGHLTPVMSMAYSPDGRRLASASVARPLILWNVDPRAWRGQACAIARTNFTSSEWEQYFPNEPRRKTCEEFDLPE